MPVMIQNYQPKDRAQIIALFDEFQDFIASLDPFRRLRRLPGYGDYALQKTLEEVAAHDGVFYVVTDQDVTIGFVAGTIKKPTQEELLELVPSTRGRITELYICPSYRKQGIATRLIQEAEKHFVQRGCDVVRIEVFVPNQEAHRLYKKLGYRDADIDLIKQIPR